MHGYSHRYSLHHRLPGKLVHLHQFYQTFYRGNYNHSMASIVILGYHEVLLWYLQWNDSKLPPYCFIAQNEGITKEWQ